MNVALGVSYCGEAFNGWQIQPHAPSVQAALEAALEKFLSRKTGVMCAGRTDAGVHATGQVVHFECEAQRPEHNWVRGLNTLLPPTVAVHWMRALPQDFHARFSATARTYEYWLYNAPSRSPVLCARTGWVWRALNAERMMAAAEILTGEHDFSAFRAAECQAKSPVRTIEKFEWCVRGPLIGMRVTANAFLHHMVRNIVGSLVYVGIGRTDEAWLKAVLESRNRSMAAPTFAPQGLYLTGVRYPGFEVPQTSMGPFGPFDAR